VILFPRHAEWYKTVRTCHVSRIKESWERNIKFYLTNKKVCDFSDLCHICRQSVANGRVATVSTSALFPRREMCPQVTDFCKIWKLQKRGFNLGRSGILWWAKHVVSKPWRHMMCWRRYCVGSAWSVPCEGIGTARQSAVTLLLCTSNPQSASFIMSPEYQTQDLHPARYSVTSDTIKWTHCPFNMVFPNFRPSLQEGSERLPPIWTSFQIQYWLFFPSLDVTQRGDEDMHFIFGVRACVRVTRKVSELKAVVSVELRVFYLFKDKIVLNVRVF
jgi:hypothetical protein